MTSEIEFELVVPAYNEAKNLPMLIEKTVSAAKISNYSSKTFNLIIVNNGSSDDSTQVLQNLANQDLGSWFRVVKIEKNQGYGYGLWAGLKTTSATYVAWSHADLQCDPVNAFKALRTLKSDSGQIIVKGVRFGRDWKDVAVSRVFENLAQLILGLNVYEMNAQPKVFKRDFLATLKAPPQTFAFDLYALYCAQKNNYIVKTIDVEFPSRIHGVSNWASSFLSRIKTILGIIKYMQDLAKKEGRLS